MFKHRALLFGTLAMAGLAAGPTAAEQKEIVVGFAVAQSGFMEPYGAHSAERADAAIN